MALRARYQDGRSSRVTAVTLDVTPIGITVTGDGVRHFADLPSVAIGQRLGNLPREIRFADGSACEVDDNDALDEALARAGIGAGGSSLHRFERRWGWALAALAGVLVLTVLAVVYGIPWAARHAAGAVPRETDERVGRLALEELDDHVFEPSALPPERQRELGALFLAMAPPAGEGRWAFRLELRRSDEVGANAFALPGGIVILTDTLVEIAGSDDEIRAVLAHEIGHVVHRHSMRMLLQNSFTALVMLGLLGDVGGATAVVATVPAVLVQAQHSRQFELEADAYAVGWLERNGLSRSVLRSLLERLEQAEGVDGTDFGFLSSHPPSDERG